MSTVIITGSAGLIGSEAVDFLSTRFDQIAGIDNNMRAYFFGEDASTEWKRKNLEEKYGNYIHFNADIRNWGEMEKIFMKFSGDIKMVVHCAAQPSHDWAAKEPITDFTINAEQWRSRHADIND